MLRTFTLEYWMEDGNYVGRLREVPGVFSQGASLDELEKGIMEGYKTILEKEQMPAPGEMQSKELQIDV